MQTPLSTIWLPLVVLAVLLAGAAWWWWRARLALVLAPPGPPEAARTVLSTAQNSTQHAASASQPQAALVLGSVERKAYRLLREAFPRAEVLAHVQLLRFIRMPPRELREGWLQGAGVLDADLLLCDGRFRVLAAVDVRTRRDSAASKERNERMAQVLQAAGISVHVWHEEALPSVADIRATVAPALAARKARARAAEAAGAAVSAQLGLNDTQPATASLASAQPDSPPAAARLDHKAPATAVPGPHAPAGLAPPSVVLADTRTRDSAAMQGHSSGD